MLFKQRYSYTCLAIFCLAPVCLPGCVIIVDDPSAKKIKCLESELEDFSGTFENEALYTTKEHSLTGITHLTNVLGTSYIDGHYVTRIIDKVEINASVAFEVRAFEQEKLLVTKTFEPGTDFWIENGGIVFPPVSFAGGHDSPGFGFGSSQIKLALNADSDLVVTHKGWGAGMATIFPIAQFSNTVSVFRRIE